MTNIIPSTRNSLQAARFDRANIHEMALQSNSVYRRYRKEGGDTRSEHLMNKYWHGNTIRNFPRINQSPFDFNFLWSSYLACHKVTLQYGLADNVVMMEYRTYRWIAGDDTNNNGRDLFGSVHGPALRIREIVANAGSHDLNTLGGMIAEVMSRGGREITTGD